MVHWLLTCHNVFDGVGKVLPNLSIPFDMSLSAKSKTFCWAGDVMHSTAILFKTNQIVFICFKSRIVAPKLVEGWKKAHFKLR